MVYLSASSHPQVQEPPSPYSPFSRRNLVYEISLKLASPFQEPKDLGHANRLVQALLQGEALGAYELLDFLVWPEGLLVRLSLKKAASLSECLKFLKERSTPAEKDYRTYWKDEPQWLRLVPPEKLQESTRSFLETAEFIHRGTSASGLFSSNLFFFYRNPRYLR